MSTIRIQNDKGKDVVTIDLNTGAICLLDGASNAVSDAAATWWRAVATVYETVFNDSGGQTYKDLVLRSPGMAPEKSQPQNGDIVFLPGKASKEHRGGGVKVYADYPRTETPVEAQAEECPVCHGDPRGVLLLNQYVSCERCG